MDYIVYVLIVVFCVLFAFIRKSQKKQHRCQTPENASSGQMPATFEEVLRQIFRPREIISVKTVGYSTEVSLQEMAEEIIPKKIPDTDFQTEKKMYSIEVDSEPQIVTLSQYSNEKRDESGTGSFLSGFNARRAINYSIILNRPYA
jgi:hypothetical protein